MPVSCLSGKISQACACLLWLMPTHIEAVTCKTMCTFAQTAMLNLSDEPSRCHYLGDDMCCKIHLVTKYPANEAGTHVNSMPGYWEIVTSSGEDMPTSVMSMSASTAFLMLYFRASLGSGTPCFSACLAASMHVAFKWSGAGFHSAVPCTACLDVMHFFVNVMSSTHRNMGQRRLVH